MIRGRLTGINGRAVESARNARTGEENFATREQNLTWASELGPDNRIIAGRWWSAADVGKPLVSLATEFQESLGVRVGDRLTFDIAGETPRGDGGEHPQGEVGQLSSRTSSSCSPPGCSEGTAGTYMTSAYFTARLCALAGAACAALPQRIDLRHR